MTGGEYRPLGPAQAAKPLHADALELKREGFVKLQSRIDADALAIVVYTGPKQ